MKKTNSELNQGKPGIPSWLFMTLSFLVPIYGYLTYFLMKDSYKGKAKVGLFFALLGTGAWLLGRLFILTH